MVKMIIIKKLKNQAILGHFSRSIFKIFFNHGEDKIKPV